MKYKISFVLNIVLFVIFAGAVSCFSQEQNNSNASAPEIQTEAETQWVWGEVVSMDLQKNELLVQYLDYDTDQEREVDISADDATTYENAGSLIDIKPSDTVGIDFVPLADGRNLAKKISVEKPETAPSPQQAAPNNPETASHPTSGQ